MDRNWLVSDRLCEVGGINMDWAASIELIITSMVCGAVGALAINVLPGIDVSITATTLLSGMVGAACCIYES